MIQKSKCFVPCCKSGYKSRKEKHSLFSAPKDETRRNNWEKAIRRKDVEAKDKICDGHFEESQIIKGSVVLIGNKQVFTSMKLKLTVDACPSIFPGMH